MNAEKRMRNTTYSVVSFETLGENGVSHFCVTEFFAEVFTAWKNGTIDKNDPDLKWVIDFFETINL